MPSTFHHRINILWDEAKDNDYRITQKEFAEKFGGTRSQLQGWLNGAGQPDTEMLKNIARTCNVSVDWLVGNTDIRTPITTIAAHRTDDPTHALPEEARRSIEDFKKFIFEKHGIKLN